MSRKLIGRMLAIVLIISLVATGCAEQKAVSAPEENPALPAVFGNVVTASGKVVPARWATLSFETGGRVEWLVAEGSEVDAGEVLARLDATDLEHAVAQARAALATAQAQLAVAKAGATPEEIAAAEGAVAAAQGGVAVAEAALAQAEISPEIANANLKQAEHTVDATEAALAQAQGMLDAAKANLTRAQAELARLQAGARPEEIAAAEAALRQAQAGLEGAKQAYDVIAWQPGAESTPVGIAYRQALATVEQAQAQVDLLKAGATEEEIAAAKAGVSAAQAQVTIAEAGVDAAEAALTQAQDAVVAAQGQEKLARTGVAAAQAQVEVAEGQLAQAEAQRDRLKAGATAEEIAILEAQVAQAEAALAQAESALAKTTLVAPFEGTVGLVYLQEGEVTAPGTPVLVLGDLSTLRVETTDLDEMDVARVAVGQQATVTFDALPERVFAGHVIRVSPMAEPGAGGVHYTVVIVLDETDPAIRWGMTAFVDIEVGE